MAPLPTSRTSKSNIAQYVEILKLPLEKYAAALSMTTAGISTFKDADMVAFRLFLQSSEVKEVCVTLLVALLVQLPACQNDSLHGVS
jgi:hypothetical protein